MLSIIDGNNNERLINDDEYFYINLLELKENFEIVNYKSSNFIKKFESHIFRQL